METNHSQATTELERGLSERAGDALEGRHRGSAAAVSQPCHPGPVLTFSTETKDLAPAWIWKVLKAPVVKPWSQPMVLSGGHGTFERWAPAGAFRSRGHALRRDRGPSLFLFLSSADWP